MKQAYFLCLLFVSLFSNSQIINFPDANFKAKLLAANTFNQIASIETPILLNTNYQYSVNSHNIIDTNNNGEIELSEAQVIKYLSIENSSILNLPSRALLP